MLLFVVNIVQRSRGRVVVWCAASDFFGLRIDTETICMHGEWNIYQRKRSESKDHSAID